MKIKFLATGQAPDSYSFSNETINGFDLSPLQTNYVFSGNEETFQAGIRDAYRDENGELHVTLMQRVLASQHPYAKAHWRESTTEINSSDYDPYVCYVVPTGVSNLIEGTDYEIVWAQGLALNEEGWTIKEVS